MLRAVKACLPSSRCPPRSSRESASRPALRTCAPRSQPHFLPSLGAANCPPLQLRRGPTRIVAVFECFAKPQATAAGSADDPQGSSPKPPPRWARAGRELGYGDGFKLERRTDDGWTVDQRPSGVQGSAPLPCSRHTCPPSRSPSASTTLGPPHQHPGCIASQRGSTSTPAGLGRQACRRAPS